MTRSPTEIACDESGSEGEKLIGGNTTVFAHASLRLTEESAAECIQEIRNRAPSPTLEYKSSIIRRSKHRHALKWLLGSSSPLHGEAHVFLIDKTFHVVGRIVDLFAEDGTSMAAALYRDGEQAFGPERWTAFLQAFNELLRARNGRGSSVSVDMAFGLVDALRLHGAGGLAGHIMELLSQARPRMESYRTRLVADPAMIPALDLLVPAIVQAVLHWGEGVRPVSVVHDRQTLLTDARIAQLKEILSATPEARLSGMRLVDSRLDARVQVADLLAGAARQIAEDELDGRGDEELIALLRPYVDASSIWGDERSWSSLGPVPSARP
ncbi:DUF3800 domain-containing protein [Nonomuraea dietziae]|uniref:DUF3800 domain-containing protein n=1 Tax=Nonomuraea dietziae TaxID=65515 RepID=A0A7W5VDN0_9ACTN|nr:DUF3800 domain-containing protein [Nonomuraea dietziae]MBB3729550.1 hypothetical protein [Nonomuraea dietziae]